MPNVDQIELEAKRQRLAWELAQGADVEEQLTAIEDQLGRLQRQAQRDALAAAEAEQQAIDRAAAEREEEAIRQKARLRATLGGQMLAAGEVEAATATLCEAATRYLEIGKEAYVLSGGQRSTLGQRQLEAYLTWRLTEVLPRFAGMPKPDHAQRRPLTEALSGETEHA